MQDKRDDEYDRLFRVEYPQVLRTARLVVGDVELAREVTQDAFAELFVRWRRIRRYDRPGAWVRRVAIRKAVRARRRDVPVGFAPAAPAEANAPDAVGVDVQRALATLSSRQRAAAVLFYLHDMPIEAVATTLRCRPGTVRVHLHRARTNLGRVLGEEAHDVP